MKAKGPILLTGATGFIGSHVLEALAEAGYNVRVFARPSANLSHVQAFAAEVRHGCLENLESLRAAMEGCGCVIHTAARAKDWGSRDQFWSTNVHGTMNVLRACRAEGIAQVIITGSISTYGEESQAVPKDETWPANPHYRYFLDAVFPCAMNHYRDSKAEATRQAVAYASIQGMNLTVLEPVWVYGEREFGTGFYAYLKAVKSGLKWMPGSVTNRFSVIYARDLARAYLLACERGIRGVERILVGPSRPGLMRDFLSGLCREAGLRPPRQLPKWTVYPIGLVCELWGTVTRRSEPPALTRGRVNTFYDSIEFAADKARRTLGFECRYEQAAAIRQTVSWYQQNGFL